MSSPDISTPEGLEAFARSMGLPEGAASALVKSVYEAYTKEMNPDGPEPTVPRDEPSPTLPDAPTPSAADKPDQAEPLGVKDVATPLGVKDPPEMPIGAGTVLARFEVNGQTLIVVAV